MLSLRVREDRYRDLVIDLLMELAEFDDHFSHLAGEDNGLELVRQAQDALGEVRRVVAGYSDAVRERERLRSELVAEAEAAALRRDHANPLAELLDVFYALCSDDQAAQQRGKKFEELLNLCSIRP